MLGGKRDGIILMGGREGAGCYCSNIGLVVMMEQERELPGRGRYIQAEERLGVDIKRVSGEGMNAV